ncbi:PAS domain S-box protein [Leptospira inadai serovar Lyme str. 10]|uniref:PAS domain S-box protein n=2 Tax=Leptospira inadai serovar Lyme TaxID=293084 RepID=V6HE39_9LEPT|nr:PAS domain S-box protein [Leptospira inadai]EQA38262.1 PAS domain S-box protein [Leptospira inadai serovar Lyme str. 10]PNV74027.1 diguanylate cyclase [Leptospira inadai serovar Lyme]
MEDLKEYVLKYETLPDILLICDVQGHIAHISGKGLEILGLHSGDVFFGKKLSDFFSDSDRAYIASDVFPSVLREGEWRGYVYLRKKVGEEIPVLQIAPLLPNSQKRLSFFLFLKGGSGCASVRNEAIYKAFRQSRNAMFLTDKSGVILAVNRQFETVSGFREDELIGKTPKIFQSGQTSREFYDEFWEKILSGKEFHGSFLNRNHAGKYVQWNQVISPIQDEEGRISNFLSMILSNNEVGGLVKLRGSVEIGTEPISPPDIFRRYEGLDKAALVRMLREKTKLTRKETEICAGIASGKDKSLVCEELGIHQGTMKNHLKSIYRKTIDLEKDIPGPERDKLQRLTIYLFRLLGD